MSKFKFHSTFALFTYYLTLLHQYIHQSGLHDTVYSLNKNAYLPTYISILSYIVMIINIIIIIITIISLIMIMIILFTGYKCLWLFQLMHQY